MGYDETYFRSFSETKEDKRVFATNAFVGLNGTSPKAGNVMRVLGIRDAAGLTNDQFGTIFSALRTLGGNNNAASGHFSTKNVGEAMGTGVLANVYPTEDLTVSISMTDNTLTFPQTQAGNGNAVLHTASAVNGKIADIPGGETADFLMSVSLKANAVNHTHLDTKDSSGNPTGCYAIVMRSNSDSGANYVRLALLNFGGVKALQPLTLNTTDSWADRCLFRSDIGQPTVDQTLFALNGPYDAQLWVREANTDDGFSPASQFVLA